MKKTIKKLKILTLADDARIKYIEEMLKGMEKYFEIENTIDSPDAIEKYLNSHVDILFIWSDRKNVFKNSYYGEFKKSNKIFKYVVVKKTMEESDYHLYKDLVDDIVYYEQDKNAKWKILAILRRHWDSTSKDTTIIYKDIIADLIDNRLTLSGKRVDLTSIEWKLFKFLIESKGHYISKNKIFEHIWGYAGDTTRTLDQMMFKLKKKIGKEYFHSSRKDGIKFE